MGDCRQAMVQDRPDPFSLPSPAVTSIGVVGGGQLALMLAQEAPGLGLQLHLQAASASDPAVPLASSVVLGDLDDVAATAALARRCQVITFENEWVPLDALQELRQAGVRFLPDLEALASLMCKRAQRDLLQKLALPIPRWCPLEQVLPPPPVALDSSQASVFPPSGAGGADSQRRPELPQGLRFPLMAKSSRGGYDGKGTVPIPDQQALEALLAAVDPSGWLLEEMVAFDMELALVAARDQGGNVVCYPLVQTQQQQQVCDWVLFPAPVSHAVEAFARNIAASLLTALDYVGLLAIEFFYGPAGLQINELAPRTHNSGHYTIEACACSQFGQQLRLAALLPMGSPEPLVPGALMVNLLGREGSEGRDGADGQALAALPGAHLHWYGKSQSSPGRKLGHLTLLLQSSGTEALRREALEKLQQVRAIWPLPQGGKLPLE
jgi:5-(carboxyamino)imidazole ribonucleotide synthase